VIHKNVISLCVHTEKTGNEESYGAGVCCIFRVGRDCVCRTVLGEKLQTRLYIHSISTNLHGMYPP